MGVLVLAAITDDSNVSGLSSKLLFLLFSEARKAKAEVTAAPVSGKGLLLGLQMTIFFLYSVTVENRGEARSLVRALILSGRLYPYDLITSQRPHFLISSYWRLGVKHMKSGGIQTCRP